MDYLQAPLTTMLIFLFTDKNSFRRINNAHWHRNRLVYGQDILDRWGDKQNRSY